MTKIRKTAAVVGVAEAERASGATRIVLLALAASALVAGVAGGLHRIGVALFPAGQATLASFHGPFMVLGFLQTLIAIERAVALRKWVTASPVFSALGLLGLALGLPLVGSASSFALSSLVLVFALALVLKRQPSLFHLILMLGALCSFVANVLWATGQGVPQVVYWWMGFLLFTIVGERLDLARIAKPGPRAVGALMIMINVFVMALVAFSIGISSAASVLGMMMVALSVWLFRFDIARRTVRIAGLPRFVAACLLSGYVWLLVSGLLLSAQGALSGGPAYDATLHAFFVGFVFSMIFGHAPIIFPSVLRKPIIFGRNFYLHFAFLQASMALRLSGDLLGSFECRKAGALLNVAAIAIFGINTALSVIRASSQSRLRSS